MTAARHLSVLLFAAGGGTVLASLGWWVLTFWPTVSNDYLSLTEASRCLVADTSTCRLATSFCGARHALLVATYSPLPLWVGLAAAFGGLCTPSRRYADAAR